MLKCSDCYRRKNRSGEKLTITHSPWISPVILFGWYISQSCHGNTTIHCLKNKQKHVYISLFPLQHLAINSILLNVYVLPCNQLQTFKGSKQRTNQQRKKIRDVKKEGHLLRGRRRVVCPLPYEWCRRIHTYPTSHINPITHIVYNTVSCTAISHGYWVVRSSSLLESP